MDKRLSNVLPEHTYHLLLIPTHLSKPRFSYETYWDGETSSECASVQTQADLSGYQTTGCPNYSSFNSYHLDNLRP